MATLDYIDIPVGATRLRSLSNTKNAKSHDIRPAPKIFKLRPPKSIVTAFIHLNQTTTLDSLVYGCFVVVALPQPILSAPLPPLSPNPGATLAPASNIDHSHLSSRDPLSFLIMYTNSK
jgi:hypothetical protein